MQLDSLSSKSIAWLQEALPENPRLSAQLDNNVMKYIYKPPHKIKTRAALIALFKKYHTDGKGALLLSELSDCISNAAKVVETLGSVVIDIPTQVRVLNRIDLYGRIPFRPTSVAIMPIFSTTRTLITASKTIS